MANLIIKAIVMVCVMVTLIVLLMAYGYFDG